MFKMRLTRVISCKVVNFNSFNGVNINNEYSESTPSNLEILQGIRCQRLHLPRDRLVEGGVVVEIQPIQIGQLA